MEPADYLLLKLIESAGRIEGRKKLQKLIYLLQLEGYPIDDEFSVHYYGPYSSRLALRVDGLVEDKLLAESERPVAVGGIEYVYELTPRAQDLLRKLDSRVPDDLRKASSEFQESINELCSCGTGELELAATIAYWRNMGNSGSEAEEITARMKKVGVDSSPFRTARALAKLACTASHDP